MPDDIVFRLKSSGWLAGSSTGELIMLAAHEIEQLRARVMELEQACDKCPPGFEEIGGQAVTLRRLSDFEGHTHGRNPT